MWTGDRSVQIPFGRCVHVDHDLDIATVLVNTVALSELTGGNSAPGELTGEVVVHDDLFFPPPVDGDSAYLDPKLLDPHAVGLAKLRSGGTVQIALHKLLNAK